MTQHVSNADMHKKKPVLWTPWGSQRVPDLDKVLEKAPQRRENRRPSDFAARHCAGKIAVGKMKPAAG